MRFSLKIRSGPILVMALGMVIIFFLEFLGFFEGIDHHGYDLFEASGIAGPG